jgi:hypothetical protein
MLGEVGYAFRIEHCSDPPSQTRKNGRHFLGRSSQATYDLRRLSRKGLIRRLRKKHRYELTPVGRRVAVLFTKTYGRILAPGLALLDPAVPDEIVTRSRLATAWRTLDRALEDFTNESLVAA